MPSLTQLRIWHGADEEALQWLGSVLLPSLRSLELGPSQLQHVQFLQPVSQLHTVTLYYTHIEGVSALRHLTGLRELELRTFEYSLLSAAAQSELGGALSALTNLQLLAIDHAPPGPVADALAGLSSLTQLRLANQQLVPEPGLLTLPSTHILMLHAATNHLLYLDAPQLQYLSAKLEWSPGDVDELEQLCRGVLRACSQLSLSLSSTSKEEAVALISVLGQGWQPSEAAQQVEHNRTGGGEEEGSSREPARSWSLEIIDGHCSRRCLSMLPRGITRLTLWWVSGLGSIRLAGQEAVEHHTWSVPHIHILIQ